MESGQLHFTAMRRLENALQQYGGKLDIVYNDPAFPNYASSYEELIFWNGTIINR